MKAVTPTIPGWELPVTIYAKDQPEYNQLPCYRRPDGFMMSRWKLGLRERLRILFSGNLWLTVLTFNHPLQPVRLDTTAPKAALKEDL